MQNQCNGFRCYSVGLLHLLFTGLFLGPLCRKRHTAPRFLYYITHLTLVPEIVLEVVPDTYQGKCQMKKILFIGTFLASLWIVSCTKDATNDNPYVGTSWSRSVDAIYGDDYLYIITFTDSCFDYYRADINGNYESSYAEGAYTYSGNEIYIDSVKLKWPLNNEYITGATVEGNKLKLHIYELYSSGDSYEHDWIMMKR